jgi:hypothetical protein
MCWRTISRAVSLAPVVASVLLTVSTVAAVAADGDAVMRVESQVFKGSDEQAISRSLALFTDDVVWDLLELPDAEGEMQLAEIVLHDPLRERTVLVDPRRGVKVEVDKLKLDRLRVSLATWARGAEDPIIRWAASSQVKEGIHHDDDDESTLVLTGPPGVTGPKVRYRVQYEKASSREAAERYQQFADVSLLLKALVHPGGLPPFPRMAINSRLVDERAIPSNVQLALSGELPLPVPLAGDQVLRSEHHTHPQLLAEDRRRISEASVRVAEAASVSLEVYANPEGDASTDVATSRSAERSVTR